MPLAKDPPKEEWLEEPARPAVEKSCVARVGPDETAVLDPVLRLATDVCSVGAEAVRVATVEGRLTFSTAETLRLTVAGRAVFDITEVFVAGVPVEREGPKWLVDGRVEGVPALGATAFSARWKFPKLEERSTFICVGTLVKFLSPDLG